jgi:mono/diheme cytochrome c family protein
MKQRPNSLTALIWSLPAALLIGALLLGAGRAEAPTFTPAQVAEGQAIYEASCRGCHALGDGRTTVGPDLVGISDLRERELIIRYTVEPDVMRAEGHPIALELAAAGYRVAMPNRNITREQAEWILAYIDQRTAELAEAEAGN